MDRSRFLAALIGPTLGAVAVSLLINHQVTGQLVEAVAAAPIFVLFAGIATLPIGIAIVATHNIWKGWPVIITIFGWLGVIGGAARILAPVQISHVAVGAAVTGWPITVALGVILLLALFLSWKAFRA